MVGKRLWMVLFTAALGALPALALPLPACAADSDEDT
jgi:hypothetical protein